MNTAMVKKSERFSRLISALMGEYPMTAIDEPMDNGSMEYVVMKHDPERDITSVVVRGSSDYCAMVTGDLISDYRNRGFKVESIDGSNYVISSTFEQWEIYTDETLPIDFPLGDLTAEDGSPMAICALGMMEQVPYTLMGKSDEIRSRLITDLHLDEQIADCAVIAWRKLDNGLYGWIVELANGAVYFFDNDKFCFPTPRVELSPAHVDELLLQIDHFATISEDASSNGDIDRTVWASQYVLEISKILG